MFTWIKKLFMKIFSGQKTSPEVMNTQYNVQAEFLMGHINDISIIYKDDNIEDIYMAFKTSGLDILPVCSGTKDNIVGTLSLIDFTEYIMHYKGHVGDEAALTHIAFLPIKPIKNMIFVPLNSDLFYMISMMFTHDIRLFIVVDEFGGTDGVITSQTILEGIYNNYIKSGVLYHQEDGSLVLDGNITIAQLQKIFFNLQFNQTNTKTLSGLLLTFLGKVPQVLERFNWNNYECVILEIEDRKITKVAMRPNTTLTTSKKRK